MSVVYGRQIEGRETTFGTTGYTYDNTFVLYDRATESIWYPLSDGAFEALSGPHRGRRLDFITKPEVTTLEHWIERNPQSDVLLGASG